MRRTEIHRKTRETDIRLSLDIDGTGTARIETGIPFFDHMLESFARHGRFDLGIEAAGDLAVDAHHTIEDIGIALGKALAAAVGEGKGITRFADAAVPMDEALARVALDLGGRGYLVFEGGFSPAGPGGIPGDLIEHFFYSLCTNAGLTAHISLTGRSDHHVCEAAFKAFGRALRAAVAIDPAMGGEVPSTKGTF
ncbi:MAG TPA: imidazoleglycerol-phosphate dehydratase HisB [Methanoculleus sp.]|jgi:imidazoleglycerol-phosphate dehydratase|nr:imidazoleglycerol-phosphate dehydratase HisB [Methanoculleus sp.]HOB06775.1 imidazoleglycerol-phosphate dehydratase HisB [Methanoculleus sp.]HON40307.1 imidazoleglycerol-phosphate dehydratase HisB [Methanoculleus sp.]HPZ32179.1 imidazoleglycerol-phosphate dehydratase HisB [Methanoculleus sp.]HQD23590.1 imidazoleglycerol-phosphate dehydratase HisB [Methanoculleus sp.]